MSKGRIQRKKQTTISEVELHQAQRELGIRVKAENGDELSELARRNGVRVSPPTIEGRGLDAKVIQSFDTLGLIFAARQDPELRSALQNVSYGPFGRLEELHRWAEAMRDAAEPEHTKEAHLVLRKLIDLRKAIKQESAMREQAGLALIDVRGREWWTEFVGAAFMLGEAAARQLAWKPHEPYALKGYSTAAHQRKLPAHGKKGARAAAALRHEELIAAYDARVAKEPRIGLLPPARVAVLLNASQDFGLGERSIRRKLSEHRKQQRKPLVR